jgi:hypothetical protein
MQTTNQLATHAYYQVLDASCGLPLGSHHALMADMGDQWVMFGLVAHCDSSGNLIEPGKQLLFAIGQEYNGDTVRARGKDEEHRVTSLPNGEIDINTQATSADELKTRRMVKGDEIRGRRA